MNSHNNRNVTLPSFSTVQRKARGEPFGDRPQVAVASQNRNSQVTKLKAREPGVAAPQVTRLKLTSPTTAESTFPDGQSRSGWEFKVVRAKGQVFQNPAMLRRLCRQEARTGWVLVEKLDSQRVRFKRSLILSDPVKPIQRTIVHHQTQLNPAANRTRLLWMFAFLTALILPAVLAYRLVSDSLGAPQLPPSTYPEPSVTPASRSTL